MNHIGPSSSMFQGGMEDISSSLSCWVVVFYSDEAATVVSISLDLLSRNIIIIGRNMNAA